MKIDVLLIEDNLFDASLLKAKLRSIEETVGTKYEVDITDTLSKGIKKSKSKSYQIILLDLNLPDSEGLGTVIKMRASSPLPIIVFTGQEGDTIGIESVKNGAQDYVYKGNLDAIFIHKTISFSLERYKLNQNVLLQKLQFEKIINSIPDAIIVINKFFKIFVYNKSFQNITQLTSEEVKKYYLPDSIQKTDEWIEFEKKIQNNLENNPIEKGYFIFKNKSGEEIHIQITCQKWDNVYDSGTLQSFFLLTIQDYTEQLKYQQALKDKQMAEETSIMKQQFMANMSHEMRTPLNIINGNIYLLQSTSLSDIQKNYLKSQKFASDSLLAIINNILDFSQIESGRLELELLVNNFKTQCEKIFKSFYALAQDKNLKMEFEYDPKLNEYFQTDIFKISQVITNLLANAVKYTDEGNILFKIEKVNSNEEHTTINILVEDTGVGIPKEKFNAIFESFTQLPTKNKKKYSGTGLGLSIVKELIHFLGGTIRLKSEPKKGSTFIVTLDLKNSDQLIENIDISNNSTSENTENFIKILLVEDHIPNQILTKTFLKNWYKNIEISIADNGRIALEFLKKEKYNLILMDLQMPEMDGFQTTIAIRNSSASYKEIPIIAVTAHALKSETDRCMEVGMNDFITKPIDPEVLQNKINKLLDFKIDTTHYSNISETPEQIEELDNPIKLDYLKKLSMNNADMIYELLVSLKDTTPTEVVELKKLLEMKDYKQLSALAHKMKATASYFGQTESVSLFNSLIENARKEVNIESIPSQVNEVTSILENCLKYLDYEIQKFKN